MRHRRTAEQHNGGEKKAISTARNIREEGRQRGREREKEGGMEKQRMAKATQTHLRAEKKRGEMRAGTSAREIREEGVRENGEKKKEGEKEGEGENRRAEKGERR